MLKIPYISLFAAVLFVASTGCSKYQKLLKSDNAEEKYEWAVKYYEKGDAYRALQLLDELVIIYRGTAKAELVNYYIAKSYYENKDYIMAAYYFKLFTKTYPKSPYLEECAFLHAYCYYLESPKYSLDQTSTIEAIKETQAFINKFPTSHRVPQCNEMIDKLRFKLETKAFEIARLYYKTENYRAAIYSFRNLLKDYPDTEYRERAMFLIAKANYLYAQNSIKYKKTERYNAAVVACEAFSTAFPASQYSKEAEGILKASQRELERLNINNS